MGRVLPLPRRRASVGQSGVAIQLGPRTLTGACPAVGLRGVAIQLGLRALTGARAAIQRSALPIGGSLSPGQGGAIEGISRGLGRHLRFESFCGLVALLGRVIALVGCVVALLGGLIAPFSRLVALLAGLVAPIPRLVAPVAGRVALMAGLVTLMAGRVALVAGRVALSRRSACDQAELLRTGGGLSPEASARCLSL